MGDGLTSRLRVDEDVKGGEVSATTIRIFKDTVEGLKRDSRCKFSTASLSTIGTAITFKFNPYAFAILGIHDTPFIGNSKKRFSLLLGNIKPGIYCHVSVRLLLDHERSGDFSVGIIKMMEWLNKITKKFTVSFDDDREWDEYRLTKYGFRVIKGQKPAL